MTNSGESPLNKISGQTKVRPPLPLYPSTSLPLLFFPLTKTEKQIKIKVKKIIQRHKDLTKITKHKNVTNPNQKEVS